jgi:hypothetical protein
MLLRNTCVTNKHNLQAAAACPAIRAGNLRVGYVFNRNGHKNIISSVAAWYLKPGRVCSPEQQPAATVIE